MSDFYVIDYPWKDEDIELLKSACRARGFELHKDPRRDPNWINEEARPVRDACKIQIDNLSPFLSDTQDSIDNRNFIEDQKRKYYIYIEFHRTFGGREDIVPIE